MANLFAWLLAAAWPIVKNVMLALGIGWITYEGIDLVVTQVTAEIAGLWGAMPTAVFQLASLGGFPQAVGIVLGGIAGRAAIAAVGRLGKVTT